LSFARTNFNAGTPQAIADIDGDGKGDFVFANSISRKLSVGDALAFAPGVNFQTETAKYVTSGDLDGDGKLDLAVVNNASNTISLLRNTSSIGNISFAPKVDLPFTGRVAIGDLNGDGKPDLAIHYPSPDSRVGTVSVFLNVSSVGTLAFASKVDFPTQGSSADAVIADFDVDGKLDIGVSRNDGSLSVLRNTRIGGSLSFAGGLYRVTGSINHDLVIGDLDRDGKPDLVAQSDAPGQRSLDVFRNTSVPGTISFASQFFSTNLYPSKPVIGDLTGDGKPEVVVESVTDDNTREDIYGFDILINTSTAGSLSLAYGKRVSTFGADATIGGIVDLNGDGKSDLLVGGTVYRNETVCTSPCSPNNLPAFLNNGLIILDATCANNDGTVSIIPTSGTAPFMYSIDGGTTYVAGPGAGYSFQNLSAGIYKLRLKDANGCESAIVEREVKRNCTITCTPPTFLNNGLIVLDATCANNDGNLSIIPTSGTAPFMYSKDGGATYVAGPNSGSSFQNLSAGIYRLRLKDANGCESVIVEREVKLNCASACTPPTFVNNGSIVLDPSCANNDGNVSIIPTRGTAPFMYSKDGGATYVAGPNTGYSFTGLAAGTYRLRLKDATGCETAIVEKTLRTNGGNACSSSEMVMNTIADKILAIQATEIKVYPNPNNGQFKIKLQKATSPKAEVSVMDAKGTLIQKRSLNLTQTTTADFDLKGKTPGLYFIKVVSGSKSEVTKVLIQ